MLRTDGMNFFVHTLLGLNHLTVNGLIGEQRDWRNPRRRHGSQALEAVVRAVRSRLRLVAP